MHDDAIYREDLFNRQRKTNLLPFPKILNIETLAGSHAYDQSLIEYLKQSAKTEIANSCFTHNQIQLPSVEK
jgi:hypothetical protein